MRKTLMMIAVFTLTVALYGNVQAKTDGAAVYKKCSGCHKATGVGHAGIFPPLAGSAAKLANADRAVMIQVALFGLKGEIKVDGKTYDGTMPAYGDQLNDEEIAAVLNFTLSSWGNDKMLAKGQKEFTAADVKAQRGKKLTPDQVYGNRQKLKL